MKEGFYKRTEFKVVMYEFEGRANDTFVIFTSDVCPENPTVLTGENATNLVNDMVGYLDKFEDEEG